MITGDLVGVNKNSKKELAALAILLEKALKDDENVVSSSSKVITNKPFNFWSEEPKNLESTIEEPATIQAN